ncbi:MAG: amidohydrolase family protein, partial [Longimicrobiales bacterium]
MPRFSSNDGPRAACRRSVLPVLALLLMTACATEDVTYDLAIVNGHVVDPATGLSAVTNIGILDGVITSVTEDEIQGARVIDAAGHVVSPGFVDLHEHGQAEEAYGFMVRDGVTSAFELEVGTGNVAEWYAEREGGQLVNYGVSVGHIKARMEVLEDPGVGLLPAGVGGSGDATEEQIADMEAILRQGLDEGAVAIG